jgi:prepilin-type processing-associated H-X9-DG protein
MTGPTTFRDDNLVVVRTIVRVHRAPKLALALVLALTAVAAAPVPGGVGLALAEERPIAVGTELMATSDVTLHKAEIARGSRVSVTKLSQSGGQVESVNVALADGHVVKVTMAQVHTFFQVVEE